MGMPRKPFWPFADQLFDSVEDAVEYASEHPATAGEMLKHLTHDELVEICKSCLREESAFPISEAIKPMMREYVLTCDAWGLVQREDNLPEEPVEYDYNSDRALYAREWNAERSKRCY